MAANLHKYPYFFTLKKPDFYTKSTIFQQLTKNKETLRIFANFFLTL